MKAVQFGAGNIGRGFLGQLLTEGGYEVVFVDVDTALVDELNRRGSYPLRLVDSAGSVQNLTIGPVRAVHAAEQELVAQEFATADLAITSVGANALPKIAPLIAGGIAERARIAGPPIDILLCENQWHAAPLVKSLIEPLLTPDALSTFTQRIGLVETVVGRMVPKPPPEVLAEDHLLIVAEPYHELPCARDGFKGAIPKVPGLVAVENFDTYEARKLYLFNAGHAAIAYLGYKHHEHIWECVADPAIHDLALRALGESGQALTAEYGFDPGGITGYTNDLMVRFSNKVLGDTVARVAADPLRKLRPDDRLIGSANLCLKHGIEPAALARVIAAALRFDNPADPAAVAMQARIAAGGLSTFLSEHCGVPAGSKLAILIEKSMEA